MIVILENVMKNLHNPLHDTICMTLARRDSPPLCDAGERDGGQGKPAASPAAEEPAALAGNISYLVQYNTHFSLPAFGPEQAFYATTESVHDHLLQRWDNMYLHFHKTDPKQIYYLFIEYLQGRTLTNAVRNLGIIWAYAEAVKYTYELEAVAGQERDAALRNSGSGRLHLAFGFDGNIEFACLGLWPPLPIQPI